MCDYSERLIAWLDHELAANEAADLERHVRLCAECRNEVGAYNRVSRAFDAYCDATCDAARDLAKASNVARGLPPWLPLVSGAAAAAAIVLFLTLPRAKVERPRLPSQIVAPSAVVSEARISEGPVSASRPAAMNGTHAIHTTALRRGVGREQNQNAMWAPAEPAIQIAIPADAMFAPGAVPEGVNYTADISIEADGSIRQLRLRP